MKKKKILSLFLGACMAFTPVIPPISDSVIKNPVTASAIYYMGFEREESLYSRKAIADGVYKIVNYGNNFAANYAMNNAAPKPIVMSPADSEFANEQHFNLVYMGDGKWKIELMHSDGGVWNCYDDSPVKEGTLITKYSPFNNNDTQLFYIYECRAYDDPYKGTYAIISADNPNLVVGSLEGDNHPRLTLQEFDEKNPLQRWSFEFDELDGKLDNINWNLTSDGILTLSGSGDMPQFDYDSGFFAPWDMYEDRINKVVIADGITSISEVAFYAYDQMTDFVIPKSVVSIGEVAFRQCFNLTSFIIPDGVTSIGYATFEQCENMKSVIIPDTVTSIGCSAFNYCRSLSDVTIPDSVTSIDERAFGDCISLTNIVIPDSVTSIGYGAFGNCSSLSKITIKNKACEIADKKYTISDTAVIYGYSGSTAEEYAKKYNREFIVLDDEPITETKLGDVDGDGTISAMDASAALTYYVTQPEKIEDLGFPFNEKAADWDENGIIDARDASAILTYYVNNN